MYIYIYSEKKILYKQNLLEIFISLLIVSS